MPHLSLTCWQRHRYVSTCQIQSICNFKCLEKASPLFFRQSTDRGVVWIFPHFKSEKYDRIKEMWNGTPRLIEPPNLSLQCQQYIQDKSVAIRLKKSVHYSEKIKDFLSLIFLNIQKGMCLTLLALKMIRVTCHFNVDFYQKADCVYHCRTIFFSGQLIQ